MIGFRGVSVAFVAIAGALALPPSLSARDRSTMTRPPRRKRAANSKPGDRHSPGAEIATPTENVSPQEQAIIARPYFPFFNAHPKNPGEWKELVARLADMGAKQIRARRETSRHSDADRDRRSEMLHR